MRAVVIAALFASALIAQNDESLLDRVAVTVGGDAITETEIFEEIRVTALLNGEPLDFSPKARREAAERLIDQTLIRRDMKAVKYPEPENSEADKMLSDFKRTHFPNDQAYREALDRYGVTEQQLKTHMLWQLAALRYTDYRFRAAGPPPSEALRQQLERESQERAEARTEGKAPTSAQPRTDEPQAAADSQPRTEPAPPPNPAEMARPPESDVDRQMDEWLKQTREHTRIRFHQEVFQ